MGRQKHKGKNGSQQRRRDSSKGSSSAGSIPQQLAARGWVCHQIVADGNCLFRSLYDQLGGSIPGVRDHVDLREAIVDFVEAEKELYCNFLEDDQNMEEYLARMRKPSSWGGHVEMHACCLCFGVNCRVFQPDLPSWTIKEFPEETTMMVYLTYHDGNHYNSIRSRESGLPVSLLDGKKPARPAMQRALQEGMETLAKQAESGVQDGPIDGTSKKGQCPCGSGRKYRKCCKKIQQRTSKTTCQPCHQAEEIPALSDGIKNIDI
jgi:hypothetical protein